MASYKCPGCGYVYDEKQGDPHEGFLAGTLWMSIPDAWSCPGCSVRDKADFFKLDMAFPLKDKK